MPFVGTSALTELWSKVKTALGGKMGAVKANGYYGMATPDGNSSQYIRATTDGILPSSSNANGVGAIGTASWPFRSLDVKSISNGGNVYANSNGMYEAWLQWGGRSLTAVTPVDAGCVDEFGHNKLAFMHADCIAVEYSTDGGATWVDYGATDDEKVRSVSTTGPGFYCGKRLGKANNGTMTKDNVTDFRLRYTIYNHRLNNGSWVQHLYTSSRKILLNVSTNGAGSCKVKVSTRTIGNRLDGIDTYVDQGTYSVSGWSGWNSIPFNQTFGGNVTSQKTQIGELRLEFWAESVNTSYESALNLIDVRLIGLTNWTTPSELARAGHLYTISSSMLATFPYQVTATQFNGPLNGTATSVGTADGMSTSINRLTTGGSDPMDGDYYIAQYAGGGTTTTTYHRRPHSALWNYIKGKISSVLGLTATNYGGKAATADSANPENSFTKETTIGASTDWNTIVEAGWYKVASSSAWTAANNAPVGAYTYGTVFVLRIGKTGSMVAQTYYAHSSGKVYSRNKFNASDWTSWVEVSANTWRGIQDSLTSDSATDSLSAKQGKALKALVDAKADSSSLATVATSGAYSDLSGKPSIPTTTTVANWGYLKSTDAASTYATQSALDSVASNVIVFGTPYTFANDTYTFTAKVWKGGVDVTANYNASAFSWQLNDQSGQSVKTVAGSKTFMVAKSELSYIGSVIGSFEA